MLPYFYGFHLNTESDSNKLKLGSNIAVLSTFLFYEFRKNEHHVSRKMFLTVLLILANHHRVHQDQCIPFNNVKGRPFTGAPLKTFLKAFGFSIKEPFLKISKYSEEGNCVQPLVLIKF